MAQPCPRIPKRKHPEEEEEAADVSIKKVKTDCAEGLAPAVADHYNQLENTGLRERSKSPIFYLRNFNNWVKSMLIGEFLHRLGDENVSDARPVVLDMGCGKGGDMLKWRKGDIRHLICVDIAETSVEQCRSRYSDLKERNARERHPQPLFSAEFIAADCSRVRLQDQLRNPNICIDLVSIQFSLHYGFESLQQAEQWVQNVADRLRPGGYFLATIPDAQAIMARLDANGGKEFGNDVFSVKRRGTRMPPALFGEQYDFFLEGVVDCPEFFVFLPLLVKLCKRHQLELVYKKRFDEMFDSYKSSSEGKMLLGKMQALETYPAQFGAELLAAESEYEAAKPAAERERCVGTMSRSEWEACSLYLAVGFKKSRPLPPT